MPIYRGTQKIAKIYRGTQEIKSIYRGTRQVFSNSGGTTPVHLFGDVYKAQWVKLNDEASSSNILLSFVAINNFDQYKRKYLFVYTGTPYLIMYKQTFGKTTIGRMKIWLGGAQNTVSLPTHDTKTSVLIDRTSLYINNNFVSNLTIGETLDSGTSQDVRLAKTHSFYEMKIYDNDVLAYHFVPAYQQVGSTIQYGIAELIHQQFQSNVNVIGEPEYE